MKCLPEMKRFMEFTQILKKTCLSTQFNWKEETQQNSSKQPILFLFIVADLSIFLS